MIRGGISERRIVALHERRAIRDHLITHKHVHDLHVAVGSTTIAQNAQQRNVSQLRGGTRPNLAELRHKRGGYGRSYEIDSTATPEPFPSGMAMV